MKDYKLQIAGLIFCVIILIGCLSCSSWMYGYSNGSIPLIYTDKTYNIESIKTKSTTLFYSDENGENYTSTSIRKGTNVEFLESVNNEFIRIRVNGNTYFVKKNGLTVKRTSNITVIERIQNFIGQNTANIKFTLMSLGSEKNLVKGLFEIPMNSFFSLSFFLLVGLMLLLYKAINFFFLEEADYLGVGFQPLDGIWSHRYVKLLPVLFVIGTLFCMFNVWDVSLLSEEKITSLLLTMMPPTKTVYIQDWIIWGIGKGVIVTVILDYIRLVFVEGNHPILSICYLGIIIISTMVLLFAMYYLMWVAMIAFVGLIIVGGALGILGIAGSTRTVVVEK